MDAVLFKKQGFELWKQLQVLEKRQSKCGVARILAIIADLGSYTNGDVLTRIRFCYRSLVHSKPGTQAVASTLTLSERELESP